METLDLNQVNDIKKIILSWNPETDIEKVENIEINDWMITYTYDWILCLCENKMQEESTCIALLARITETRLLVEEKIRESKI